MLEGGGSQHMLKSTACTQGKGEKNCPWSTCTLFRERRWSSGWLEAGISCRKLERSNIHCCHQSIRDFWLGFPTVVFREMHSLVAVFIKDFSVGEDWRCKWPAGAEQTASTVEQEASQGGRPGHKASLARSLGCWACANLLDLILYPPTSTTTDVHVGVDVLLKATS